MKLFMNCPVCGSSDFELNPLGEGYHCTKCHSGGYARTPDLESEEVYVAMEAYDGPERFTSEAFVFQGATPANIWLQKHIYKYADTIYDENAEVRYNTFDGEEYNSSILVDMTYQKDPDFASFVHDEIEKKGAATVAFKSEDKKAFVVLSISKDSLRTEWKEPIK